MKLLQICPPHLSDVATLSLEIQKSHFRQYYLYILVIVYIISEEQIVIRLPTPPEFSRYADNRKH